MNLPQKDTNKVRLEALHFLKNHHTMVISTISPSNDPQAAVIYYVVDEMFNFYFMTSLGSKKSENLRANGKVAFVVGAGPTVATMQGGGVAESLNEQEAQVFYKLIEEISLKSPWQWPLILLSKKGFCTFRIKPIWMTWLTLDKDQYPDVATEQFYKII